jgi:hypothetical protein
VLVRGDLRIGMTVLFPPRRLSFRPGPATLALRELGLGLGLCCGFTGRNPLSFRASLPEAAVRAAAARPVSSTPCIASPSISPSSPAVFAEPPPSPPISRCSIAATSFAGTAPATPHVGVAPSLPSAPVSPQPSGVARPLTTPLPSPVSRHVALSGRGVPGVPPGTVLARRDSAVRIACARTPSSSARLKRLLRRKGLRSALAGETRARMVLAPVSGAGVGSGDVAAEVGEAAGERRSTLSLSRRGEGGVASGVVLVDGVGVRGWCARGVASGVSFPGRASAVARTNTSADSACPRYRGPSCRRASMRGFESRTPSCGSQRTATGDELARRSRLGMEPRRAMSVGDTPRSRRARDSSTILPRCLVLLGEMGEEARRRSKLRERAVAGLTIREWRRGSA